MTSEREEVAMDRKPDSLLEKQAELEGHYKSACAQEVLLIEQLKQVQKNRECLASQLDLLRSLAA